MIARPRLPRLRLQLVLLYALATMGSSSAVPHARADKPQSAPRAAAEIKATLTPVTQGVAHQVGYDFSQTLTLAVAKPPGIVKEPSYSGTPMYVTLHFGADANNGFPVALDIAGDGSKATLYVDAERKGDLTTQAAPLNRHADKGENPDGKFNNIVYEGAIKIAPASSGGSSTPLSLLVYMYGAETAKARKFPADTLYYSRDYARSGKLTLGAKTYPILLLNDTETGRYDVIAHGEKEPMPVALLIDRNGDGKFDFNLERYDVSKPFNIGGTTYEITKVTPDGAQITLRKAAKPVAEVAIAPNVDAGQPSPAFTSPVIGGKTVKFPGDYRGKIVLVDFWATWCVPCVAELPGIVTAYQKYHARGLEVLSVSLDGAGEEKKVAAFLKPHNMTWEQVYDGKAWASDVVKNYGIQTIPHAFLVDGTTGKILVEGNDLRGDALDGQICKALAMVKVSRR